jgi:hypothetical protein
VFVRLGWKSLLRTNTLANYKITDKESFMTLGPSQGQVPVVNHVTGEAVEELDAGLGHDPLVVKDGQTEVGVAPQRQHFI